MNYASYAAMLGQRGTTRRARVVAKSAHDTLLKGPDSPAYKEVEIEGVKHNMMVISSTVTNQKIIRTLPGDDFEIGKIMLWSKSHWLITERDADDEITVRGKIELCNRSIQWQDDETGEVITRWAVVDKPYFSNLSENKLMSLSSREFQIKIPYDDESSLLDIGKRLMLEEINGHAKTYRITCVDGMTERYDRDNEQTGFLVLNLEQDQYDPNTDKPDKSLCDYDEPKKIPDVGDVAIKFSGEAKVRMCGRGKVFHATRDGKPYADCVWTIEPSDAPVNFDNGSKEFTGDTCRIKADNDLKYNGSTVTLMVEAPDKSSADSVVVKVVDA